MEPVVLTAFDFGDDISQNDPSRFDRMLVKGEDKCEEDEMMLDEMEIDLNQPFVPRVSIKLKLNTKPETIDCNIPTPIKPEISLSCKRKRQTVFESNKKRKSSQKDNPLKRKSSQKDSMWLKQLFKIPGHERRFGIIIAILYCTMNNMGAKIKHNVKARSIILMISDYKCLIKEVEKLRIKPCELIQHHVSAALKLWFIDSPDLYVLNSGQLVLKKQRYNQMAKRLQMLETQ